MEGDGEELFACWRERLQRNVRVVVRANWQVFHFAVDVRWLEREASSLERFLQLPVALRVRAGAGLALAQSPKPVRWRSHAWVPKGPTSWR